MVAGRLRSAGVRVEVHDDHFPPAARDQDWLGAAGKRGWVVLTKDRRIQQRTPELVALARAGVRAFVLTAGDLQGSEMGAVFVRALPAMERRVRGHPAPFVARVSRRGTVMMLMSAKRLRRVVGS